jgi:high-affinity Fe2+/Pb2+ permease
VRLATTTPMIPTILYGSMLFYTVQHNYLAAALYFIYTLIVHGYFAPSIILFAIFSNNFKQDLAYFAC